LASFETEMLQRGVDKVGVAPFIFKATRISGLLLEVWRMSFFLLLVLFYLFFLSFTWFHVACSIISLYTYNTTILPSPLSTLQGARKCRGRHFPPLPRGGPCGGRRHKGKCCSRVDQ
jgi:hypothetical protein